MCYYFCKQGYLQSNTNTKMLEFLKGKKNHFIGIDFGTSAIKVVELSYRDQQIYLENYGIVELNFDGQSERSDADNASSYEQKLNDALRTLVKKMGLKNGSQSYVSIPGFSGLITIIELPEMQQEELAKAIQFEAHKYIPSSLDEVAMSWEIVEHVEAAMPEPLIMAKRRAEGQVPVEVPLTPEHENGIDKTIKEIFERYL